jgi:hypothetical protein
MSMQNDQDFKNYKVDEHHRINTVIYGSALTAVVALYTTGHGTNSSLFIAAFLWALLSYSYWFFAEGHIASSSDRDSRQWFTHSTEPAVLKLREDLGRLIDRCRNRNLYTIIVSWILNVCGASMSFFHNASIPHWLGWILIYGSLLLIPILVIREYWAANAWDKRFNEF